MFSNLKSNLKEKSGKDVPKFVAQKSSLSRASRQGSQSSVSSLILDPASVPQNSIVQNSSVQNTTLMNCNAPPSPTSTGDMHQIKLLTDGKVLTPKEVSVIARKEDEWRGRLEKKDAEWSKKYEKRESELLRELAEKETDWSCRERELTEDLLKQTNELKDALKLAEDLKRKVIDYQEEKDQVESFQTQEMAKVKHLLLAKERDNSELQSNLKESQSQLESFRTEVSRLKSLEQKLAETEEELEMVRHAGEKERQSLVLLLTESQEQVSHLSDRVTLLAKRSSDSEMASEHTPDNRIQALLGERTLLERRLEEAHIHLTEIKASWSAKISSLETQVGRLSRQAGEEGVERRRAEQRVSDLEESLTKHNEQIKQLNESLEQLNKEKAEVTESNLQLTQIIEELRSDKKSLEEETKKLDSLSEKLNSAEKELEKRKADAVEFDKLIEKEQRKYEEAEMEMRLVRQRLEQEMDEARESMERETRQAKLQSEELVLRNAQLSQQADMAHAESSNLRQELEQALTYNTSAQAQITSAQQEASKAREEFLELERQSKTQVEASQRSADCVQQLTDSVADLEARLAERNKTIRVMQQNLSDMQKTLRQRESRGGSVGVIESNHIAMSGMPGTANSFSAATLPLTTAPPANDINFQYLKHVIVKFLTSREYEAQQLTKAVATLLQLTAEEELLIRDTLDWKTSWFRTRPKLQDYS